MNVLVTGGAGYIGSHAVQRLARDGHTVVALDNLFRGHAGAMERLGARGLDGPIDAAADTSRDTSDAARHAAPARAGIGGGGGHPGRVFFVRGDVGDRGLLDRVFRDARIDTIMHFAALAYVGESVEKPLAYYRNNTSAALTLLEAADAAGIGRVVFSSTCATYGEVPENLIPIPESCPQNPMSPYGMSKLHVEHMLRDHAEACRRAGRPFAFAALRYFNVAGCDRSGLLGEHHEPETHLIPVILQAALGQRDGVTVFGDDYPTPDGTCIRDYVHVEDLIDAHVRVMERLRHGHTLAYNVGIGNGLSVRQIIDAARRVTGRDFPVRVGPRRAGDPPMLYADPTLIRKELGWEASITDVDEIIRSAWDWMRRHPKGYAT